VTTPLHKRVVSMFTFLLKSEHFYFMDWSGRLLDSRGNSETGEPLHGTVAEEAARRSPTGKQVACNGNPFSPFT